MNTPPTEIEFMGRDWCHVYRVPTLEPCINCGDPTYLRVTWAPSRPRSTLPICGRCRGY